MVIRGKSPEGLKGRTLISSYRRPPASGGGYDETLQRAVAQLNDMDAPVWLAKVTGMLQQNWASEIALGEDRVIVFVSDTAGVFDVLELGDDVRAIEALRRNGFESVAAIAEVAAPPIKPFHVAPHPNGPIYSSGRFWIPEE